MGAGGWGGGAGHAPAPLSGGGGTIPPASGGGGRGPRGLRAEGGAGGGVSRRGLPAPLLGGGLRYSILAPFVSPARSLPACACGQGPSAAPGWGGVRGGLWTAPPGALADLNPPSALPEWAVVTRGLHTVPLCALLRHASVGSREQVQPPLPPPRRRPFLGGGGRPRGSGGAEGRACGSPAGGGAGGGAPPPALGPEWEGGGGVGGALWSPSTPPDGRGGGRHGSPGPGGQPSAGGSRPSPAPLYLEPDPHAGPRWGPSSPRPLSRGAGQPGAAVRVSVQMTATHD